MASRQWCAQCGSSARELQSHSLRKPIPRVHAPVVRMALFQHVRGPVVLAASGNNDGYGDISTENRNPPDENASKRIREHEEETDGGTVFESSSSLREGGEKSSKIEARGSYNDERRIHSERSTASNGAAHHQNKSPSTQQVSSGQYSPEIVDAPSTRRDDDEDVEDDVLIEFKDVYKSFGSKAILQGASFKIRRGEAVGIIGSSGTGKSTTLRLAAGLLEPDSGEVLIKGEARRGLISDDDTTHKLKIGLVFQSGALFDSLTVRENVGFMLLEHTRMSEEAVNSAVSAALAKVGLHSVENLYPSELSGGMRKRVALARAIVSDVGANGGSEHEESSMGTRTIATTTSSSSSSDYRSSNTATSSIPEGSSSGDGPNVRLPSLPLPLTKDRIKKKNQKKGEKASLEAGFVGAEQLIMYDEPTAGLDPVASTVIEDLIRSMHDPDGIQPGGHGISSYVVVTHQHSTIRRAVDRLIFLHGGRVVWEGPVEEFDTTDEPIVRQFASGSLKGPIVYV